MGSLVPFQDLNYPPLTTPKIEPKIEPLDEFYQQYQQNQQPHLSNATFLQSQLPVHEISQEEQQVYAEFHRISEMFRSAFGKKRNGELQVLHNDELSIVPQPLLQQMDGRVSNSSSAIVVKKAMKHRSGEMVRVTDLGIEDQIYFRDLVRRTRMMYESLRIYLHQEEENVRGSGFGKRARGDLKAATLMKDRSLWLNRDKRIIGSIPGVFIGDVFFFRMELCVIGLHGHAQAGIDYVPVSQSSSGEPVATSIIVSGGYEDDEDAGDVIIYTGHGGQSRNSVRQCVHQKLEGGNRALERSKYYGIEVRVIRGVKCDTAPAGKIYIYDGLYKVTDCWFDIGKSGFGVYKYKIVRMPNQPEMGSTVFKFLCGVEKKSFVY
ncbi:hypothetical protein IFM89_017204 [Coptis chinensis]|uniref:YDG domain-containing protein n=1 Tax=Coptis chinensis TaxID=261450 RepID=A0A835LVZ5_9MAGN|nr:hypothetical protein IFM89_017204 [Coptis chinensis]